GPVPAAVAHKNGMSAAALEEVVIVARGKKRRPIGENLLVAGNLGRELAEHLPLCAGEIEQLLLGPVMTEEGACGDICWLRRSARHRFGSFSKKTNRRQSIKSRYAHQIVDFHPFVDRVLAAGSRAMRDGGHIRESPEAVAVVHKGFRTFH